MSDIQDAIDMFYKMEYENYQVTPEEFEQYWWKVVNACKSEVNRVLAETGYKPDSEKYQVYSWMYHIFEDYRMMQESWHHMLNLYSAWKKKYKLPDCDACTYRRRYCD